MREKIEKIIFYLLIFAIPVQARVILFEWVKPFNQWTSVYLYGTDLLLAAVFILWLIRSRSRNHVWRFNLQTFGGSTSELLSNSKFFLILFFIVSALSIINSRITGLSFYQLLKLAEFIGFYFYLKSSVGKVFSLRGVLIMTIASGLSQSIIAIAQYVKQGSIGLRLLGESPLSVNATGVAVFIADGERYLRAYGTAPHPNILAAWLFVAIFAFYLFYLSRNLSEFNSDRLSTGWQLGIYGVLLWGFFLTFSRVIIGLWVLGVLTMLLIAVLKRGFRNYTTLKQRTLSLFVVSVIVTSVFLLIYWPQVSSRIHISAQEEAVTQRVFYNKIAESTAVSNPFLGVGIGQFVPDFMSKFEHLPPNVFQPVHNIYLLIASETGFLGLGVFLLFLLSVLYNFYPVKSPVKSSEAGSAERLFHGGAQLFDGAGSLLLTIAFLLVGLFDHFLWTSQQGSFIFWMVLALFSIKLGENQLR